MSLLPWHQSVADALTDRLASAGLPHALLIAGPEGWGEVQLANWLAATLLGLDVDRDVAGIAHPDLRWLEPEGAVIKVDAVRDLVAFAQGTPQAGPRKVAVIADAHGLNRSAANALLKTLEEPPAGTHLVLTSSHPGRLLPTIRSRCQRLVIRPDAAAARRWLEPQVDPAELEQRLFEHGGAPVAVLRAALRGDPPLSPLLERALAADRNAELVQMMLEQGLADTLGRWYRYVLALTAGDWRPAGLEGAPGRALMKFADELTWARRLLVTSNSPNERLVAERVLARWRGLARSR